MTAPPFDSWLRQREEFESERALVFEVKESSAEIEAGWYVNFFQPRSHEPERFGPYSSESQAVETRQLLLRT